MELDKAESRRRAEAHADLVVAHGQLRELVRQMGDLDPCVTPGLMDHLVDLSVQKLSIIRLAANYLTKDIPWKTIA